MYTKICQVWGGLGVCRGGGGVLGCVGLEPSRGPGVWWSRTCRSSEVGWCSFTALLVDISDTVLEVILELGCHSIDLLPRLWLLHLIDFRRNRRSSLSRTRVQFFGAFFLLLRLSFYITLRDTEIETKTENDIDIDKITQNPIEICIRPCLWAVWTPHTVLRKPFFITGLCVCCVV